VHLRIHSSSPAWHVATASGLVVSDGVAKLDAPITVDRRFRAHFASGRA